ncbi:MAG: hypothetical protein JHD28_04100 [Bacteroidia bacterium]|nr:hypothetical protein [Bacteroidia bacterium]
MKKILLTLFSSMVCLTYITAQEGSEKKDRGEFSGNFQNTNQFYVNDPKIGTNTTQYKRELSSSDAWLFLSYKLNGFKFNLRYDVFNNSPLFNPSEAYTKSGIGMWNVSKDIDKFNITVGYFYDQFGTGMVFRAFEDRNLGLDFAINGARVIYTPSENTQIKAFTGLQKFRFDVRPEVIKGVNIEHRIEVNEDLNFQLGASGVNRTIDQGTMNTIVGTINNYELKNRFIPTYNVYLGNVYNTLSYKKFSLYTEYCQKSQEAIFNPVLDRMELKDGRVYYTSLSFSTKGLGINAQYKRIESFSLRTSPLENLNLGMIAYLPSLTRQNTYRLLARYNAVVQELGENALGMEFTIKPQGAYFKKHQTTININTSVVTGKNDFDATRINPFDFNKDTTRYFREHYIDVSHKFNKKFKAMLGFQYINYNQQLFEQKTKEYEYVTAKTYFGEITYKLTPTRSLRVEAQYLDTKQDLGSFINGTVELNIAPHYSFSVGDMVNVNRVQRNTTASSADLVHYWNVFGSYTYKTTRMTAGYIKQVEGVNCTGGVCRVEPAFSGVRVTLQTNF